MTLILSLEFPLQPLFGLYLLLELLEFLVLFYNLLKLDFHVYNYYDKHFNCRDKLFLNDNYYFSLCFSWLVSFWNIFVYVHNNYYSFIVFNMFSYYDDFIY